LDATPPTITTKEVHLKQETKILLKLLDEKIGPIFKLIIFTGLRRGETLGLNGKT
jgi:integrase